MYNELYVAWRCEMESATLGSLSSDFYVRIADYLRRIKEENRMLDKKTVKVSLLEREMQNVKCMLRELIALRYRKLLKIINENQKVPSDLLTVEESKMFEGFLSFAEAHQRFVEGLLLGQVSAASTAKAHKRVALRFVKEFPAVIGADMKTYGPFAAEDVASVPAENARILIKQGVAALVEVS